MTFDGDFVILPLTTGPVYSPRGKELLQPHHWQNLSLSKASTWGRKSVTWFYQIVLFTRSAVAYEHTWIVFAYVAREAKICGGF